MIHFNHVSMTYKQSGIKALEDVSFHIDRGEFCFVIGESGAGKSTLIKLLTREEFAQEGEVVVSGYRLSKLKQRQIPYLRRNIGMVFQDFRLIETKTVFENIAYAMEIVGANKRQIARQVPLVLSTVGLRQKADMRPHELSGGEQQRVAIARAMVNRPMMILADEPTGNLDPATSEAIMVLLSVINKAGTTVIVCTHDRELVDRMQRRVLEFSAGRIIRDQVSSHYMTEEVPEHLSKSLNINQEAVEAVLRKPKIRSPFNFIHAPKSEVDEILNDSEDVDVAEEDRVLAQENAREEIEWEHSENHTEIQLDSIHEDLESEDK